MFDDHPFACLGLFKALERAVQKVCEIFPKVMALWNRNVYIDLNGERQNLETKQITSQVFSYMFLTSIVICVFIISDIFYDM